MYIRCDQIVCNNTSVCNENLYIKITIVIGKYSFRQTPLLMLTISVETIRDGRVEILSSLLSETDFYMTYTKLKVLSFKSCFPVVINFSPNSSVSFVNKLILIFFSTNITVLCSIFPRCHKTDRIIIVQTVFVFDSLSSILLEIIHILLFHFFLSLSSFFQNSLFYSMQLTSQYGVSLLTVSHFF